MDQKQEEVRTTVDSRNNKFRKLGAGFIVLSFILYGLILVVPFTPFSTGVKVGISTALAVTGEVSFWVGGLILGKEVVVRLKKYINPVRWFKR
ncbi:transporter suffix domain-containing protein [Desulfoscipio geothermicus]|jgi:hypothetical protein|uniref:Transporter suffix domain-containing protein n=1 Tax=Desulfoscipio geothermicus DSM 3669 TaxID=1121426 RepID=A0A1I6D6H1_9FIRM|nr:transporter suffix domain-containing protein [Desulfoscipio geothermicus]SFR01059.1 hypothetical protein SAMN05660706_10654 [Desulfoscipio geothermicus DSM 3669]